MKILPSDDGSIDWDSVATDYLNQILSPWAPEMVAFDAAGRCRNRLLAYLHDLPHNALAAMAVADFGCGPGNLIAHLPAGVERLTGVDQSAAALRRAELRGREHGVAVRAVVSDIAALDEAHRYDLIVSVNSILPASRGEVAVLLEAIRRCLTPAGRLLAILPSFDTTVYLRELWRRYYTEQGWSRAAVAARLAEFEHEHKMDFANLAYADDGCHAQCYHTADSIGREFSASGLQLIEPPRKVHYPWELTRRFGYGYFPDAREEIWDWFVVAGRHE